MYYLLLTIKYTKIWKQFRHIMVSYMRMLFYRCRGTLSWTLICICVATVQHCRWQDMGQDIHKTWHHMLCSEIKRSSVCCFWGQKDRHVSALFFFFAKHIWTWTAANVLLSCSEFITIVALRINHIHSHFACSLLLIKTHNANTKSGPLQKTKITDQR